MTHPPRPGLWEILLRPSLWLRNDPADQDFDDWLNDALDRGEPIRLDVGSLSGDVYTAQIAGLEIWVENAPYADATARNKRKHGPTRRTALRFRRAIAPLLREHLRFQPPSAKE